MKQKLKSFIALLICLALAAVVMLSACGGSDSSESDGIYAVYLSYAESSGTLSYSEWLESIRGVGISSCEINSDGELIITYTDGTYANLGKVTGSDGSDGSDGSNGTNAVTTITIEDIWEYYCETVGEISYEDFLKAYLSYSTDSGTDVAKALTSSVKVYTEFVEKTSSMPRASYNTALYTGSGVIWSIDSDYVYFVTNYHVVYDTSAYPSYNGGSYFARAIYLYLYGSEDESYPASNGTDSDGYTAYAYGKYAVECTLIGASASCDIAVLRASRSDVDSINDGVQAVELADGYYVGETALAVARRRSPSAMQRTTA